MAKRYRDYSSFLSGLFPCKMQKLTVNAGFTCPNRDGSKSTGGCTYCNNQSFSPDLDTDGASVTEQLYRGMRFFAGKYPMMRYLAYFQSYTNTYSDHDRLMALYNEALEVDGVDGLIIGTRPDCIDRHLLGMLSDLNRHKKVIIEYGAESANDITLQRVNRCHSWDDTINAARITKEHGLPVGLHFIMGLPGEDKAMMMNTIEEINRIKPDTVKFHQLQLIRGTRLAAQVRRGETEIMRFTVEEYIDLCCEIIARLDPSIAIERFTSQSPESLLIYPRWGLKNYQFTNLLDNRLALCGITQGDMRRTVPEDGTDPITGRQTDVEKHPAKICHR